MNTVRLTNTDQMQTVGQAIRHDLKAAREKNTNGALILKWSEEKEVRRDKQNKLMWRWHNEYCKWRYEVAGEVFSPEQWHEAFKSAFIGTEDPVKIKGKWIIAPKSTAKLSVKEFSEMLEKYQAEAAQDGLQLTRNDDLYWQAMGVKR